MRVPSLHCSKKPAIPFPEFMTTRLTKTRKKKSAGILCLGKFPLKKKKIVLAVGDNKKRKEHFEKFSKNIFPENIIHPSAVIEKRSATGKANLFFAGSVVNAEAKIGDNNIINTRAVIEHEVVIGNHNHISVGTILCGRVGIENVCFIGAGTVVIDKIRICSHVIVGANSVIVKDITEPGIYAGNPARKIK